MCWLSQCTLESVRLWLSGTYNMLITNSHLQWVLLSAWYCSQLGYCLICWVLVVLSTLGYTHSPPHEGYPQLRRDVGQPLAESYWKHLTNHWSSTIFPLAAEVHVSHIFLMMLNTRLAIKLTLLWGLKLCPRRTLSFGTSMVCRLSATKLSWLNFEMLNKSQTSCWF